MNSRITLISFLFLFSCLTSPAQAQWATNGAGVCTAAGGQDHPVATSDGAGGVIVAWQEKRNTATSGIDVYAQRLDENGLALWAAGGIPLCAETGNQEFIAIMSDGTGGAFVAWNDARSGGTIYAQRVSSTGAMQWLSGGIPLCAAAAGQSFPVFASDGSGGAIVAWLDTRTGDLNVYAQRVDASGSIQWSSTAAPVCTVLGLQHSPFIVEDGSGGAIVSWADERSGSGDIYAQRLDASGAPLWTLNGAAVCTAALIQGGGSIASDGAGGAIIVWFDGRTGTQLTRKDIYAQRVNASGVPQWTADGVPVCNVFGEQGIPLVVSDGAGGAICMWQDRRAANWDLYAQRVNPAGAMQWTAGGVALCTAIGEQQFARITADGAGGALVAWPDGRDVTLNDVYAQRIDGTGAVRWAANGAALCTLAYEQSSPAVVPDGAAGVIVAWHDARSWDGVTQPLGDFVDIYANRVTASGWVVSGASRMPPAQAVVLSNSPNPFSSGTRFDVVLVPDSGASIDVFDAAGRRVRHIDVIGVAGRASIEFDGRDQGGRLLPSGIYFCRLTANGTRVMRKAVLIR